MENLRNAIEIADAKAQYDEYAKKILSQKIILAHILHGATEEFKGTRPEDIVPLIEGDPIVSKVRVEPGLTNKSISDAISGINTENAEPDEGKIVFDILFYVYTKGCKSRMIINVEIQRKEKVGYPLPVRALFYASRLISSQKEREFTKSNYGDMINTYSIWLCFGLEENCMSRIGLSETPLIGSHRWESDLDLLNIVLVGLNRNMSQKTIESTESELHYLLGTVFSDSLTPDEKFKLLSKKDGMPDLTDIKEELNVMCNLSYGIEEKGIETGRIDMLKTMISRKMPIKDIKEYTNASDEEIKKAEDALCVR